jgi:hypothetical protein
MEPVENIAIISMVSEEFQKDTKFIRVERMSRHLYDVEKLIPASNKLETFASLFINTRF